MKNEKTKKLAVTALLTALTFILGLTVIGYIPNPFFLNMLSWTLMCLPVIIGTIVEGFKTGLLLSVVFGITSLLNAAGFTLVPDALGKFLLGISPIKTVLVIFVPRLIIPVTTWLTYRAINGESRTRKQVATGVAAFVGSITNTVLFLGALYLFFIPEAGDIANALSILSSIIGISITADTLITVYAFLGAVNGIPEAVIAVVICIPVVWAVIKYKNRGKQKVQSER